MLMHLSPLFLVNAVKSAVPGVDRNDIHASTTAVPPFGEQVAIAAYLVTNPYVPYNLLFNPAALFSNLSNSTAMYEVSRIGEGT